MPLCASHFLLRPSGRNNDVTSYRPAVSRIVAESSLFFGARHVAVSNSQIADGSDLRVDRRQTGQRWERVREEPVYESRVMRSEVPDRIWGLAIRRAPGALTGGRDRLGIGTRAAM